MIAAWRKHYGVRTAHTTLHTLLWQLMDRDVASLTTKVFCANVQHYNNVAASWSQPSVNGDAAVTLAELAATHLPAMILEGSTDRTTIESFPQKLRSEGYTPAFWRMLLTMSTTQLKQLRILTAYAFTPERHEELRAFGNALAQHNGVRCPSSLLAKLAKPSLLPFIRTILDETDRRRRKGQIRHVARRLRSPVGVNYDGR